MSALDQLSEDARIKAVAEMRTWLLMMRRSFEINSISDHSLPNVATIEGMDTARVCVCINAEYEGGVSQFVADSFAPQP